MYHRFRQAPELRTVPDPVPSPVGVVLRVVASGLCRSDWHGWMGHDPGIRLPHVPGHELAGVVVRVGGEVSQWRPGDRVTVPFVCACGRCRQCASGNGQVCDAQTQPGFTHWGSFAEYVAIEAADINLVRLPDELDFAAAASLGCRFATAFRAVVAQGRVAAGERVAVHGCGGLGLSAVLIATAAGAQVVAVDVRPEAVALARELGAVAGVDATETPDSAAAVRELTGGGAHLSLDAAGTPATCVASVLSLRKRGRHVQVGLLPAAEVRPPVPLDRVIADELQIVGSHGMPAHGYEQLLALVRAGRLRPDLLVRRRIPLAEAGAALAALDEAPGLGVTVVTP
jgi:alcohol dehydrogenase